ncbi:MAG: hypothetical protein FJX56_04600 [Alphaproteobacteria bacterium]|nr:hypothetical protein [Alphaproteobacteria bacterium]
MTALALLLAYSVMGVAAVTLFKRGWLVYRRAGARAALPFALAAAGLYATTLALVLVLLAQLPSGIVVATTTGLVIVLTAGAAIVFLGERLTARTALGSTLVIAGVLMLVLA